jgi:hypothetical protein
VIVRAILLLLSLQLIFSMLWFSFSQGKLLVLCTLIAAIAGGTISVVPKLGKIIGRAIAGTGAAAIVLTALFEYLATSFVEPDVLLIKFLFAALLFVVVSNDHVIEQKVGSDEI